MKGSADLKDVSTVFWNCGRRQSSTLNSRTAMKLFRLMSHHRAPVFNGPNFVFTQPLSVDGAFHRFLFVDAGFVLVLHCSEFGQFQIVPRCLIFLTCSSS